jgi:hypothetical protein
MRTVKVKGEGRESQLIIILTLYHNGMYHTSSSSMALQPGVGLGLH